MSAPYPSPAPVGPAASDAPPPAPPKKRRVVKILSAVAFAVVALVVKFVVIDTIFAAVEESIVAGQCVTLSGTGDKGEVKLATCGTAESNYKVVANAAAVEQCAEDVDATYFESRLVAGTKALCLDVDWVQGACFDIGTGFAKRVDCTATGEQVVKAGATVQGKADASACSPGEFALPRTARNFTVCLQDPTA